MPALVLPGINLQDERIKSVVLQEVKRIIEYDLPDEAARLYAELARTLPNLAGYPVYQIYEQILRDLSWLLLPLLGEDERFELLRASFLRASKVGINLDSALTRMVYSIPPFIWPEVAPRYLAALRENIEEIGTAPIEVRGELGLQPPTLGKYLTDYNLTLGDRKVTPIDVLQYMNQDPDIVRLSSQDKELLKRAFRYYEGLKPLSLTEIREHLTPEEQEISELGRLPAPTPEEREMLGLPVVPVVPPAPRAPASPPRTPTSVGGAEREAARLSEPPVVRIPEQPRPPVSQAPAVDLRKTTEPRKPETPVVSAPPSPPTPTVPSGPASGPSIPTPAQLAPPVQWGGTRPPSITPPPPTVSPPPSTLPSPTVFRPIRRNYGGVHPKDVEPALEGDVVDLKGE